MKWAKTYKIWIDEKERSKTSMTIAEVSKQLDISADTLRYYERIGLLPPVPRSKGGIREYDEVSCRWVELMKCMRSAGVQIEALIEYVALFRLGDETMDARKTLLMEQRDQLAERIATMQVSLDRLNHKIEHYDLCIKAEKTIPWGASDKKI